MSKDYVEIISRTELCDAVNKVFGSEEKFLDIIEEDIPYGYHYFKYDGDEIYIIDIQHNRYINWYKLTHIGRDFHTDMNNKEEVIDFLQRLYDKWLKENKGDARMSRLTNKWKNYYTPKPEAFDKNQDITPLLNKLGKLEDIMEKYEIESLEELEELIKDYDDMAKSIVEMGLGIKVEIKDKSE